MSELLTEKRNMLAEEMGWTLDRAQGYVDGEATQLSGQDLPAYHKVAMDDYSKGFRTGYYTQACSVSLRDIQATLTTH